MTYRTIDAESGRVIFTHPFSTGWRVRWHGRVLKPLFNSRGAALAYIVGLKNGRAPV